jgi:type I restriction enzyme S subunit
VVRIFENGQSKREKYWERNWEIDMKKDWEIKKLGEVCETGSGGTPLKANKDYYEGGAIPWLMSGEVSQGEIFEAKNFITEKGLKNSSAKLFPVNTVLVAMYGATAGQTGILKFEATTNQAVCGILPNCRFIPEFLYYCFLLKKDELISLAVGNAQPNISQIKIRNTIIPVPPLPEQKRIVAKLDQAFSAIERSRNNTEQNLKNAKELFESYLQEVFENGHDWVRLKLEEVCEITSKLIDPKEEQYQDLIHVGAGNIESKSGILINLKTAKEERLISGKFLFDEEMVLYSKIRPYLIKVVSCTFKGLCSADIYPLVPLKGKIMKEFLYFLLLSERFTQYAISGSHRAGMPKVNRPHLFKYEIGCPNLKVQEEIVEKFRFISKESQNLQTLYQKKLADLEELKKSILQKAFNGEL